jgi:hypothetical protein
MWLVFSAPLGMAFGSTTWALLRGRGGLSGLAFFVLGCTIAAFVGSLAAEAAGGAQTELLTGVGAAIGAVGASLALIVTLGYEPATEAAIEGGQGSPGGEG